MMWAVSYRMLDEGSWQQLSFDFDQESEKWIGPMFWPSGKTETEKVIEEVYNSLKGRNIEARVVGHYEKKGDKWQLIHFK